MAAITFLLAIALPLFAIGGWMVKIDLSRWQSNINTSGDFKVLDNLRSIGKYQNQSDLYWSTTADERHFDDQDIHAIKQLPGIHNVFAYESIMVNLLVEEATDYATAGSWNLCYDYLSPEFPDYWEFIYSFPNRQDDAAEQRAIYEDIFLKSMNII